MDLYMKIHVGLKGPYSRKICSIAASGEQKIVVMQKVSKHFRHLTQKCYK